MSAIPPARPGAPSKPAAPPPRIVVPKDLFPSIKKYRPSEYNDALAAYNKFFSHPFRQYYLKINTAAANSSLSLGEHGELVFQIDARAMSELVMDEGLKSAIEHLAHTSAHLMFGAEAAQMISVLGFSFLILQMMKDLENERMLGKVGPEGDKWRRETQKHFAMAIIAEDLSRRTGGNPAEITWALANEYKKFEPIVSQYYHYLDLDDQLRNWQGNIPKNPPPTPPTMGPAPELEFEGPRTVQTGRWFRKNGTIILLGV